MNHEQAVARNVVASGGGYRLCHTSPYDTWYGSLIGAYLLCIPAGLLPILIPGALAVGLHLWCAPVGWIVFAILGYFLLQEPLDSLKSNHYVAIVDLLSGAIGIAALAFVMLNLKVYTTSEMVRTTATHFSLF